MEQGAINSDLIRGHIDTIILRSLLDGDKYAQLIIEYVSNVSDGKYQLNQATLYSSLKRLESLEFVNSYWFDALDEGRRKYFKITELGKDNIKENLNNWAFSKGLIDKLIGSKSQETSVIFVEKTIEKPATIAPESNCQNQQQIPIEIKHEYAQNNISDKSVSVLKEPENDSNFRDVLNTLIKVQKEPEKPVQKNQEPEQIVVSKPVIQITSENKKVGFIDSVSATDYNSANQNNGKIDFGDIVMKANNGNYKVRISSKETVRPKGNLLINKVNFSASLVISLLLLLEFLLCLVVYGKRVSYSPFIIVLILAIIVGLPLFFGLKFRFNPSGTSAKSITFDSVLSALIVVFNLLIVTIALNLISNVDFSNPSILVQATLLPITLILDFACFFVMRLYFAKKENYKIKE